VLFFLAHADFIIRSKARVQKLVLAVNLCYKNRRRGLFILFIIKYYRLSSFYYVGRNTRLTTSNNLYKSDDFSTGLSVEIS
jgi:hypothetical protein